MALRLGTSEELSKRLLLRVLWKQGEMTYATTPGETNSTIAILAGNTHVFATLGFFGVAWGESVGSRTGAVLRNFQSPRISTVISCLRPLPQILAVVTFIGGPVQTRTADLLRFKQAL